MISHLKGPYVGVGENGAPLKGTCGDARCSTAPFTRYTRDVSQTSQQNALQSAAVLVLKRHKPMSHVLKRCRRTPTISL
jgi:hypothetical protein